MYYIYSNWGLTCVGTGLSEQEVEKTYPRQMLILKMKPLLVQKVGFRII